MPCCTRTPDGSSVGFPHYFASGIPTPRAHLDIIILSCSATKTSDDISEKNHANVLRKSTPAVEFTCIRYKISTFLLVYHICLNDSCEKINYLLTQIMSESSTYLTICMLIIDDRHRTFRSNAAFLNHWSTRGECNADEIPWVTFPYYMPICPEVNRSATYGTRNRIKWYVNLTTDWELNSWNNCGLVTHYSVIERGQHWFM